MGTTWTARLRLEPIDVGRVDDLWRLHQDPGIAAYDGIWSHEKAERRAAGFAESWATLGIGKWLAYDRETGDLVGRGGVSRMFLAGAERIEVGWYVREAMWGRGHATEIGTAGRSPGAGSSMASPACTTMPRSRCTRWPARGAGADGAGAGAARGMAVSPASPSETADGRRPA